VESIPSLLAPGIPGDRQRQISAPWVFNSAAIASGFLKASGNLPIEVGENGLSTDFLILFSLAEYWPCRQRRGAWPSSFTNTPRRSLHGGTRYLSASASASFTRSVSREDGEPLRRTATASAHRTYSATPGKRGRACVPMRRHCRRLRPHPYGKPHLLKRLPHLVAPRHDRGWRRFWLTKKARRQYWRRARSLPS
jgi:hypothetical protein